MNNFETKEQRRETALVLQVCLDEILAPNSNEFTIYSPMMAARHIVNLLLDTDATEGTSWKAAYDKYRERL